MAEMLAVTADAAALLHPVVLGKRQRRLCDNTSDGLEPLRLQAGRIDRDTRVDQRAFGVVHREHLAGEGPEIVDRSLRAGMALFRAVTKADDPLGGMAQMIGALFL